MPDLAWFKVDDELHDHAKARRAGKAAIGVWTMAGSWSSRNGTNGFIPKEIVTRWGTPSDAARLVKVRLWKVGTHEGEPGWWFHDWEHFQPPPEVVEKKKKARSDAGIRGNHERWHVGSGVTSSACPYCIPLTEPVDNHSESDRDDHRNSDRKGDHKVIARNPVPDTPSKDLSSRTAKAAPDTEVREDVERVCKHLADRIEENGSKRPTVGKDWRTQARLLLDRDGRTEEQVHRAIDWCQDHDFWRSNIMSVPKLRKQYDVLRLKAQETTADRPAGATGEDPNAWMRQRR